MLKKLSFLLGIVLLLAACGGSPVPDAPVESSDNIDAETADTAADVDTTAVSSDLGDPFSLRESDYFKGAEEPTFTIIEYGDFQ